MMTKLHVRVFFLGSNWKIVIINSTLTDDNDNDNDTHTHAVWSWWWRWQLKWNKKTRKIYENQNVLVFVWKKTVCITHVCVFRFHWPREESWQEKKRQNVIFSLLFEFSLAFCRLMIRNHVRFFRSRNRDIWFVFFCYLIFIIFNQMINICFF